MTRLALALLALVLLTSGCGRDSTADPDEELVDDVVAELAQRVGVSDRDMRCILRNIAPPAEGQLPELAVFRGLASCRIDPTSVNIGALIEP